MSRALEDAVGRVVVVLVVMVGTVLAIVLPALLTTAADAPSTAVTALALALPVALLVYWVCNSAWTLGQSAVVWRWFPTPGSAAAGR